MLGKNISEFLLLIVMAIAIGCGASKNTNSGALDISSVSKTSNWESLTSEQKIDTLQTELSSFAVHYAASRGYSFGHGADVSFKYVAKDAANDIQAMPPEERNAKLRTAKENIKRMIDQMIAEADNIPGYKQTSPGKIGEQTYFNAQRLLCPLWPFCK